MLNLILIIIIFILIALLVLIINGNPLVSKILNMMQKTDNEKGEQVYTCRSPTPRFNSNQNSYTGFISTSAPNSVRKNIKKNYKSHYIVEKDYGFDKSTYLPKSILSNKAQPQQQKKSYAVKDDFNSNQSSILQHPKTSQNSTRNDKNKWYHVIQDLSTSQDDYGFDKSTHLPNSILQKKNRPQKKQTSTVKDNFNNYSSKTENSIKTPNELPVFQPSEDSYILKQKSPYLKRHNNARKYKL